MPKPFFLNISLSALLTVLFFSFPFVTPQLQAQADSPLYSLLNEGRIHMGFLPFQRDTIGEASIRQHMNWAATLLRDGSLSEIPEAEAFHRNPQHPANRLLSGYSPSHRYFTLLKPQLKQYLEKDCSASLESFDQFLSFLEQHPEFLPPHAFVQMDSVVLEYALEKEPVLVWEFYGKGDAQTFIYSLLDKEDFLLHLEAPEEFQTKLACHSMEILGETYHTILFSISLGSL